MKSFTKVSLVWHKAGNMGYPMGIKEFCFIEFGLLSLIPIPHK